MTAAETQNPNRTLPRAINGAVYRILIFYIGAIAVIMSITPWTTIATDVSPFVVVFDRMGIAGTPGIINFVVLTAAASTCNSGIFSTGRLLHTMAKAGEGPIYFRALSRQGSPRRGIIASSTLMLLGVFVNYVAPKEAFLYVISVVVVIQLSTWAVIVVSHLVYRREVSKGRVSYSPYRMPGSPVTSYFTLAFFSLILILVGLNPDTRLALYVVPVWVLSIVAGWFAVRGRHINSEPAKS
jgi:AAT family amino acid transporter/D-serine/D-alanine/glycine transporter